MIKLSSFQPTLNRVLLQRILQPTQTQAGIILGPKYADEHSRLAKVIAVGQGKYSDKGILIKPLVKPGDIVLLPEFGGNKVPIDDKKNEYVLCLDSEIPCVIKGYKH